MASSRFATTFRGHTDLFTKGLKGDGFVIKKAGTLEELAPKLGVDAEGLKKSVAAYNEAAAKGSDPEFHRNPKFLIPINTPPFYGWHLTNALTFGRIAGKNMVAEKPWA